MEAILHFLEANMESEDVDKPLALRSSLVQPTSDVPKEEEKVQKISRSEIKRFVFVS